MRGEGRGLECTNSMLTCSTSQSFKQRSLEIADKAQNLRQTQKTGGSDEFLRGCDDTEVMGECFDRIYFADDY